jgi:hypothetical protein
MIKLLSVENLGDSKYLISVLNDGETEKYVLVEDSLFIEEINESMPLLSCKDRKFSDVWGSGLAFRKEVMRRIKKIKSLKPELQAV